MTSGETRGTTEIACRQVLLHDASVHSVQWLELLPSLAHGLTPSMLLERYLAHVRRCTLTLIRPVVTDTGVEFRLARGASLLTFSLPLTEAAGDRTWLTLRINGGLLVQPRQCDRGQLVFSIITGADGIRVTLELSEYCPLILGNATPSRLRKLLYRFTQAYIHKVVTVNFLARLYRELAGGGRINVKRVPGDGEQI